jgi:hypothetical protein
MSEESGSGLDDGNLESSEEPPDLPSYQGKSSAGDKSLSEGLCPLGHKYASGHVFGLYGLKTIELSDKPTFDEFFLKCKIRLSDYTFANTFIWKDSIHLRWKIIDGCLCVFANGCGGLTLLFPPMGERAEYALKEAIKICDDYNKLARFDAIPRIEYVSKEFLGCFGKEYDPSSMSGDYVYETRKMIDLSGKDLSSKRHAKNQFMKTYSARTEIFSHKHQQECIDLLIKWCEFHEEKEYGRLVETKRSKDTIATIEAIKNFEKLGLTGMVVFADEKLVGFTFGEMLSSDTFSIVIEKTDRDYAGSAQYIFSEFCRQFWRQTKWCNVGDDWDIPSLAWTKQSYRPAFRVEKWVVEPINAPLELKPKINYFKI